jgi:hypothetical protein
MKREKRTTKKERKAAQTVSSGAALRGASPAAPRPQQHTHIHCVACGKHLDPSSFGEPGGPEFYRCQHGSDFAHCAEHAAPAKQLVDEHDRTGQPVKSVAAWH